MKRVLQEYLTIPVYRVNEKVGENENQVVTFRVESFREQRLADQRIPEIWDETSPTVEIISTVYPEVQFQIEVSGSLLSHLEVLARRTEWVLVHDEASRMEQIKRKETFEQAYKEYMSVLARMVLAKWKEAVGL